MADEKVLLDRDKLIDFLKERERTLEVLFGHEELQTPKEWARLDELRRAIAFLRFDAQKL